MRIGLVVVALALFIAPAASAAFGPPLVSVPSTLRTLPLAPFKAGGARPLASCSAHAVRSRGASSRVERKLAPVACEQPPRSHVMDNGFVIGLGP
jgi:hypothetical protein